MSAVASRCSDCADVPDPLHEILQRGVAPAVELPRRVEQLVEVEDRLRIAPAEADVGAGVPDDACG